MSVKDLFPYLDHKPGCPARFKPDQFHREDCNCGLTVIVKKNTFGIYTERTDDVRKEPNSETGDR